MNQFALGNEDKRFPGHFFMGFASSSLPLQPRTQLAIFLVQVNIVARKNRFLFPYTYETYI
jgi:hypothetical protein